MMGEPSVLLRYHSRLFSTAAALLVAALAACAAPAAGPPAKPTTAPAGGASQPTAASAPASPTTAPAAAASKEPQKVRIAVQMNVTIAPLVLADERGYFKEAGIDVDLVPMGGGSEMAAPLATGEIDAGLGGISASLFNALARGMDAKIVSDFSHMSRGHGFGGFVVRNDVEYSGIPSLRGKLIGFNNPGSPCHYMVGKMLESGGLTLTDVQASYIPFPTIPGAMAKKEIDAACAAEPWVDSTVHAGDARLVLTYDEIVPDMQTSTVMVSTKMLGDRPLTERFLKAFLRAAPDAKEKSPEVLEVVSRHTGLAVDVLKDTYWTDLDNGGRVNVVSIKDQLDFFTRASLVNGTVDVDRFVDMSYLPGS
jgi:NitT/TauT family transport system substrate-binding protein